jgi:hypothetical protein
MVQSVEAGRSRSTQPIASGNLVRPSASATKRLNEGGFFVLEPH